MTNPALHIPLTDVELKMIGEICAIQGQIEWMMEVDIMLLLLVPKQVASAILGTTAMGNKANTWIKVLRSKFAGDAILPTAEDAFEGVKTLLAGRNSFVHAYYASEVTRDFGSVKITGVIIGPVPDSNRGTPVAIRTRDGKSRPTSDIAEVREQAANLSHLFFQVHQALMERAPVRRPSP